jgi:hypothetical protein
MRLYFVLVCFFVFASSINFFFYHEAEGCIFESNMCTHIENYVIIVAQFSWTLLQNKGRQIEKISTWKTRVPHAIQFSTKNNDIHLQFYSYICFFNFKRQILNSFSWQYQESRTEVSLSFLLSSIPSLNAYNLYLFFSTNNMHFLLVWLFKKFILYFIF